MPGKQKKTTNGQEVVPFGDNERVDLLVLQQKIQELEQLFAEMGKSPEMEQAYARLAEAGMWMVHHITKKVLATNAHGASSPMNLLGAITDFARDQISSEVEELVGECEKLEGALQEQRSISQPRPLDDLAKEHLPAVLLDAKGDPVCIRKTLKPSSDIPEDDAVAFVSLAKIEVTP